MPPVAPKSTALRPMVESVEVEPLGEIHVLEFHGHHCIKQLSREEQLGGVMAHELESWYALERDALEVHEANALNVELHSPSK